MGGLDAPQAGSQESEQAAAVSKDKSMLPSMGAASLQNIDDCGVPQSESGAAPNKTPLCNKIKCGDHLWWHKLPSSQACQDTSHPAATHAAPAQAAATPGAVAGMLI